MTATAITPQIVNPTYEKYLKQCSKHELFEKMQTMLKALGVHSQQINDYDSNVGLHVGFFKEGKTYYIAISKD